MLSNQINLNADQSLSTILLVTLPLFSFAIFPIFNSFTTINSFRFGGFSALLGEKSIIKILSGRETASVPKGPNKYVLKKNVAFKVSAIIRKIESDPTLFVYYVNICFLLFVLIINNSLSNSSTPCNL